MYQKEKLYRENIKGLMEEYHRQAELQKQIEDMAFEMEEKEKEFDICINLATKECEEARTHMTKVNYSIRQYAAVLYDFCLLQEDLLSSQSFASTMTRLIIGDKSAALMKHFDEKQKSNAIDWSHILFSTPNDEGHGEREQILSYLNKRQKDGLLNLRKLLKQQNRHREESIVQVQNEGEDTWKKLEAKFEQKFALIEEELHKSESNNMMLMNKNKALSNKMRTLQEMTNSLDNHVMGLEQEVEDCNENISNLKYSIKLKDFSLLEVNEELRKVMHLLNLNL